MEMYNREDSKLPKCNINDEIMFIDRRHSGGIGGSGAAAAVDAGGKNKKIRKRHIGGNNSINNNSSSGGNCNIYNNKNNNTDNNINVICNNNINDVVIDSDDDSLVLCKRSININLVYTMNNNLELFDAMNKMQNDEMYTIGCLLTKQQKKCDNFYNLRGRIIFKKDGKKQQATTTTNNINAAATTTTTTNNNNKSTKNNLTRSMKKNKEKIINNTFSECDGKVNQIISTFNLIYEAENTTCLDKPNDEKTTQVIQSVVETDVQKKLTDTTTTTGCSFNTELSSIFVAGNNEPDNIEEIYSSSTSSARFNNAAAAKQMSNTTTKNFMMNSSDISSSSSSSMNSINKTATASTIMGWRGPDNRCSTSTPVPQPLNHSVESLITKQRCNGIPKKRAYDYNLCKFCFF